MNEIETIDAPSGGNSITSLADSLKPETPQPEKNNYSPATLKQVESALKFISPDLDRDEWVKIGMAIKSEFGDEGIDLFNEWSEAGKSYKFDDLAATWDSINAEGGITIGFLFKQAKAGGWKNKKGTPEDISAAKANKNKATQAAQEAADKELEYKEGATNAQAIWLLSSACDAGRGNEPISHPYLTAKNIKPHGAALRMGDLALLIPLYYQGELVSLQIIETLPDGTFQKKNMKGGKAKGSYLVIGCNNGHEITDSDKPVFISEGFATGCTLNEQTDYPVVITFSCNNYKSVILQIKEQYPDRRLVIAADNDFTNDNNPGLNKAKEIANELEIEYVYPDFETAGLVGSDFNDYFNAGGESKHIIEVKPVVKTVYKGLPGKYYCDDDGLVFRNKQSETRITSKPVIVKADTRDINRDNWSLLVWFKDKNNIEHEISIPKGKLHGHGSEIPVMLANAGLPIEIGAGQDLIMYLAASKAQDTRINVTSSGWLETAFVLPTEVINPLPGDKIIFDTSDSNHIAAAIHRQGALEDWQNGLKELSPVCIFLVCHALAAPVRHKVNGEGIGIHLYDLTSKGKTTSLMLAASVWGNGADPGIVGGGKSYIQKWNSTANALEGKAEIFNDLLMVIDEIGEGDPREFGQTIYRLLSGTGKGRSGRDGNLRASKTWRLSLLSAGEIGISDFIQSGGNAVKGGQLVRLMDIDLQSLPPLFKNAKQADAMKQHCANFYGCAGPLLLERFSDIGDDFKSFDQRRLGAADTEIAVRARAKFALIAYAGIKAVQAGILPYTEDQIIETVRMVYSSWMANIKSVSDIDRGIESVKNGILQHQARFEVLGAGYSPQNRIGYHKSDIYHIFPQEFKKLCGGVNERKVKQKLKDSGLLSVNKAKGLNSTLWTGDKNITVVSVKDSILSIS